MSVESETVAILTEMLVAREANLARRREWARGYRPNPQATENNRVRSRINARARYRRDPERVRAKVREWREAHPERVREMSRRWREANRDVAREHGRRWRAENPQRVRANSAAYRARVASEPALQEATRRRTRNWYESNLTRMRERHRAYYETNRDAICDRARERYQHRAELERWEARYRRLIALSAPVPEVDVASLAALGPAAKSANDARRRLGWGSARVQRAWPVYVASHPEIAAAGAERLAKERREERAMRVRTADGKFS